MSAPVDETTLIETAKQWVIDEYDAYPAGIEGFSKRDFTPTPTVILEDAPHPNQLEAAIEACGYHTKRKRAKSGESLIAACVEVPDEGLEVVYTFDTTLEMTLDSPRRYGAEPPEEGRLEVIIEYLTRRYDD